MAVFDEDAGHDYGSHDFLMHAVYAGSRSAEESAPGSHEADVPSGARRLASRTALVEIVRRDPQSRSALIFEPLAEPEDATPGRIVDAALAHRPVAL